MMGVPNDRAADFKRWSDALTGTLSGATDERRKSEFMEMAAFFRELIAQRRANPSNDLVSAVANAEAQLDARREELKIHEVRVDPGPILRRAKPRSRGSSVPVSKRTSHFTIIVSKES